MECLDKQQSSSIAGASLHWTELGSGRPLVLLHGLSDSHRTWRRVARQLSKSHRVLMVDLAGHGLSGRPDAPYDLDWHAEVVGRWIDSLGLDDIDLVGHSFGGGVAQYLLLSHNDRVRRLGLVAPGGMGREVGLGLRLLSLPGSEHLIQPFLGVGTHIALRTVCRGAFTADAARWQAWANSAPGSARAMARTVRGVIDIGGQHRHFLDRAHEIDKLPPIAVYWGERDPILPIAQAYRAMATIDGAQLTTFRCGHFPQLEEPDGFVGALSSFLDDSEARHARVFLGATAPIHQPWYRRSISAAAASLRRLWRLVRPRPARRPVALLEP